MITDRRFFISTSNFVKITRILQKTPEFREMAIMISLSELILAFFGVKQRIGGYERGEERKKKREERRRCGLRCNVLSCAVLSCAVDIYIYIFIYCSEAVTFYNVFFATCSCFKHFININIFINIHTCKYIFMCVVCVFVCVWEGEEERRRGGGVVVVGGWVLCFSQLIPSAVSLSMNGNANDWRTLEHVVLDLFSN